MNLNNGCQMHECLKRAGKKSGPTTDQIAAISIMVETMSRLCAFKLNYKHTPVLIREIAKRFGFSLQRLYKLMYSRLSLTVEDNTSDCLRQQMKVPYEGVTD